MWNRTFQDFGGLQYWRLVGDKIVYTNTRELGAISLSSGADVWWESCSQNSMTFAPTFIPDDSPTMFYVPMYSDIYNYSVESGRQGFILQPLPSTVTPLIYTSTPVATLVWATPSFLKSKKLEPSPADGINTQYCPLCSSALIFVSAENIFVSADSFVKSFNLTSGALKHTWEFGSTAVTAITPFEKNGVPCVAVIAGSQVCGFSGTTGEQLYCTTPAVGQNLTQLALNGNYWYLAGGQGQTYVKFSISTGVVVWNATSFVASPFSPTAFTLAPGVLVLNVGEKQIAALNTETGQWLWTAMTTVNGAVSSVSYNDADGCAMFATTQGAVGVISTTKLQTQSPAPATTETPSTAAIEPTTLGTTIPPPPPTTLSATSIPNNNDAQNPSSNPTPTSESGTAQVITLFATVAAVLISLW
jgi:hypothetical protein